MATTKTAPRKGTKKVRVAAIQKPTGRKVRVKAELIAIPAASPTKKAAGPDLEKLEAALVEKYPAARIVPGSYRVAGSPDAGPLGEKKATVTIECCVEGCCQKRRICSSDVWQTVTCSRECRKQWKKFVAAQTKEAGK
jgi:hypothetical protein